MNQRKLTCVVIILSLFMIFACAKRNITLPPESEADRAYYEAKDNFNQTQEQFAKKLQKYNQNCKMEEFKEACKAIDPYILKVDEALDIWEAVVEARKPVTDAQNNYVENLKELKTQLLLKLPNYVW